MKNKTKISHDSLFLVHVLRLFLLLLLLIGSAHETVREARHGGVCACISALGVEAEVRGPPAQRQPGMQTVLVHTLVYARSKSQVLAILFPV